MKKITLLLTFFSFTFFALGQISEGFETDPPAGWTFMQTEGDDPGFVQTDIQANSGTYSFYHNDDDITIESTSWMISPSLTVNTGDLLSFFYQHNYTGLGYGVENGIWISTVSADPIANPGDFTLLYDLLGNASEDVWTEYTQSLDAYAGQTVYFAFKYVGDFEDELYIDDFFAGTLPTDTLDYFNLQFPASGSVDANTPSFTVYAQAYEAGLTDTNSTPAVGIEAWIGYSTVDTNPSNGGWTWIVAIPNPGYDFNENNDEYQLDLGTNIASVGTYYYASRWRLNGGQYTYGGIQSDGSYGGTWGDDNNMSGILTINPLVNDDCAGAINLTAGGLYADNPQDGFGLTSATDSGYTNSCGGTGVLDVWYTVIVPASGNITIATEADTATGTTGCDTAIEVYTSDSDCNGTLTSIGCDDDGAATGAYSELVLTSLTPGQTLYVRLWGYGDDETDPYSISAFDASLSNNDFESNTLFSYYPNPVKEKLQISSQEVVQEITIINMLGQRVINKEINTVSPEINLSNLKSGTYFLQVTISGVTETIRIIKQ